MTTLVHRIVQYPINKREVVNPHVNVSHPTQSNESSTLSVSGLSRKGQALLLASLFFSALYWFQVLHPVSGWLHVLVKWLSILPLTLVVLHYQSTRQDVFLLCAILFHSVGDVVLAHPTMDLLAYSLGPFLVGHIFYILAFSGDLPKPIASAVSPTKLALMVLGLGYIIAMAVLLLPRLLPTPLGGPVVVYMSIFSVLAMLSFLTKWRLRWMTLGIWMYIVSDSLIALDKFYTPLPPALHSLTWPLYYIGQILISVGLLMEKGRFVHLNIQL
eukprot:TRINITY_DN475_c0_g1_i2.p1 TRINITY_DN475_c0_g1~~TRINITY_DN475_c0_g1_i2.p1  ORF type:complete len:272 (-),score=34.56 TRINITY_DN475_c0_g1_i2:399-1214(-)